MFTGNNVENCNILG